MNKTSRFFGIGVMLVTCLMAGCATKPKPMTPAAFTQQALQATASAKTPHVSSETIERFKSFNSDFSSNNIATHTSEVYATNLWFSDPFKQIQSEPVFEAYLMRESKAVKEYSMEWTDVAENNGDYYFRWIMTLKLKRDGKKEPPTLNAGVSHVRFGADGKVIFHQDYFDAGTFLYEKVPILGSGIRYIKKRI